MSASTTSQNPLERALRDFLYAVQYSFYKYWYVKSLFYRRLFQQYTISKEGIKEVIYGSHD